MLVGFLEGNLSNSKELETEKLGLLYKSKECYSIHCPKVSIYAGWDGKAGHENINV